VELAAEQRLTLVGFLRGSRFNIYTLPHRVRVKG
jgi:formate dehydrogenase assembly factor FdhD